MVEVVARAGVSCGYRAGVGAGLLACQADCRCSGTCKQRDGEANVVLDATMSETKSRGL